MTALISASGLSVAMGARRVLSGVNFSIDPGEIVTVVGPNGSGKSTFLRALIGALPATSGHVTRKADLRLGYVPQSLFVDPSLPITVARFLDLPRRQSAQAKQRVLLEAGVEGLEKRQLADLSGGQKQRVLLARALLGDPELLLLDEPTQGLDQPGSAAFYRQIETLRDQKGCAILMVSHELHVVMSASDRVICINGHICCEGHPEVVAQADAYRALFGSGTRGALALYRHEHSHHHHHDHDHDHDHDHENGQEKEAV
ncbi:metal ABC transporter ATP-binding protein [Thalassococcus lentus]|uniref:Metal ABC transporter ATP-binding protein n=1 Tax=Thalassococcus lentus TaxID=1210524 RepID=A0ABT4XUA1_9RHOB|nr:metal ABC transporter ATP-binding protein [Thalassococcus lentus]MDA7425435.1 metal ABC transporter ATP-binding protein [Thalassococcus lentus]